MCLICRWVRSVAVDPGNDWFATGSADRTIKIWDLASGQLKLTLTGHIEQVSLHMLSHRNSFYIFIYQYLKVTKFMVIVGNFRLQL